MKKESKLFDAIVKYIDENGYSPSVRELSEIVGFKSTSTVHRYLSKLEEKGYIERKKNSPRTLRIITNH